MLEYELVRSKRKSVAISVGRDLKIIVRAPLKMPLKEIECFIDKNYRWIESNKALMQKRMEKRSKSSLTGDDLVRLKRDAKELLPERVDFYSSIMGVTPSSVKITSAKTRWGSCSKGNGLCFSYRIMLLPVDIIDCIVVHELAHIRIKNHSDLFYEEIIKYMPDYRNRVNALRRMEKEGEIPI